MIIDKVRPYWTEEEEARLAELLQGQDAIIQEVRQTSGRKTNLVLNDTQLAKWRELDTEATRIKEGVHARYIKDRKRKGLLEDVEAITQAIEKQDYIDRTKERLRQLAALKEQGAPEDSIAHLRQYTVEGFNNCYDFILDYIQPQLTGLKNEADVDKAIAIVRKRVARWYIEPQPAYLPMAHGKATDAFAFINGKNAKVDPITKTGTINKFGVELAILRLTELQATLGISTDKLLSTAIANFTQKNDFRHGGKDINREVVIPLREYASLLGYDVEEHETSTPEEAEKEKKRAKNQLDNARRAIKKDLDLIHASTLTWEEPIKGKVRDFARVSLVTFTGIRNGEIQIAFSPEIASYLVERNLITQYPTGLLRISGRKPTAYYIGRKLAEHYNIDNNHIRGTHDRISVKKLLEVTDLPTYKEVQATDRGHWENRIKRFFEEALDELTREGILKDWEYTHARGIELTEEEAYNITDYADFEKLYIHFTPADTVDHTERIEAKQEARAQAREKSTAKKKKE